MVGPRLSLSLLSLAVVSAAQNAGPAQTEITQHDAPASFSSRVNLVQVPVIVRDKQGHPVGNLTKDDFILFDKGKPQYISRFAVEKAGTPYIPAVTATTESAAGEAGGQPAPPIPERFIAYLFDDVHLVPGDLLRVRLAATQHIDASLDPVTRIAIVTTSGFGAIDFTDDVVKIHAALNNIKPDMRTPLSTDCPNLSLYMADLIVNKNDPMALSLAAADAKACDPNPNSTVDYTALARSTAISALSRGEGDTSRVLDTIRALVQRMTGAPGARNIVLVSPGFFVPSDDLRPAEGDMLDRAIRANVVINTLDARGVFTSIPGGNAETRPVNTTNSTQRTTYDLTEAIADQDVLEELAMGTGGSFFHNDNGFKDGFDQLTKQAEFTYLLGFSPADLKYDGAYHALKVSLKSVAGFTQQSRRGYYAPKRPADPEEAAKEDIREQVFSRDEIQDIPVNLRMQFFKSSPANARLSIISRVDVKNLQFRKDQDRNKDTLTVVASLFDRNGTFVSGLQKTVEMSLRDQTRTTLETAGLSVRTDFDVTPGVYTIRLVVRDAEGMMMAARNGSVQIP